MYLRLGMPFYLYKYPFHQCKSLYWDNPVRVGYNPPMSSFGMLLSDLLGVLFGAEPGETLTLTPAGIRETLSVYIHRSARAPSQSERALRRRLPAPRLTQRALGSCVLV
jgi:hypothetical protein